MTNSNNPGTINHEGIVQKKDENTVLISISSESACSGCHAEGYCTVSGNEEKIIEVHGSYNVKPGDKVTIMMKLSMGYAALFLGYILPVILVITILMILILLRVPELLSGLFSLAILIPYYIIMFFSRKRIDGKFTFTIKD